MGLEFEVWPADLVNRYVLTARALCGTSATISSDQVARLVNLVSTIDKPTWSPDEVKGFVRHVLIKACLMGASPDARTEPEVPATATAYYDTQDEALRALPKAFPPKSKWLKTVAGRRFILHVQPKGKLLEWRENEPLRTWSGRWSASDLWETPFYILAVRLLIDGHETRLRSFFIGEPFKGYEIPPNGLDSLEYDERRYEALYMDRFPAVTLTRLDAPADRSAKASNWFMPQDRSAKG